MFGVFCKQSSSETQNLDRISVLDSNLPIFWELLLCQIHMDGWDANDHLHVGLSQSGPLAEFISKLGQTLTSAVALPVATDKELARHWAASELKNDALPPPPPCREKPRVLPPPLSSWLVLWGFLVFLLDLDQNRKRPQCRQCRQGGSLPGDDSG